MNITIKTGCDLVYIPAFIASVNRGQTTFLTKIFSAHELHYNSTLSSLAGKFAAKEAVIKALSGYWHCDSWLQIEVINLPGGKPILKFLDSLTLKIVSNDISISHHGDYALATSCFLIESENLADFK